MAQTGSKLGTLAAAVREQYIKSKTGRAEDCEDLIYVSDQFFAVIDGTTSKTDERWNGATGGRVAARVISETFSSISAQCTATEAAAIFTAEIRRIYERVGKVDLVTGEPRHRMGATLAAISLRRSEVWLIGDCQCLIGSHLVQNRKRVDDILAFTRALYLETEIAGGKSVTELTEADPGHRFILPLLEKQTIFQNNPQAGEYWYPAVDGFPVPSDGIITRTIPDDVDEVILATDGYPVLLNTLKQSERALQDIITQDPLLFRKYRSTKGVARGNVSFDDRAYLRIMLTRNRSLVPKST